VSDSGSISQELGLQNINPSGFSGIRELAVACYKMKDKLYPDTNGSKNAPKRFFKRVLGSLENGTRRNGNDSISKPKMNVQNRGAPCVPNFFKMVKKSGTCISFNTAIQDYFFQQLI